jgi:HSP20 family protein
MNALTKWNPFREEESDWLLPSRWSSFRDLERLQRQMFDSFFGRSALRGNGGREEAITATEWAPSVDIAEDDKEYLIKAELPELKKEEVKVRVENGMLTLSGERKFEKEEKGKKYHRLERSYGSFLRSFNLPDDADGTKVSADFKDGVLNVHLPKNPSAKPKSIEVKVS